MLIAAPAGTSRVVKGEAGWSGRPHGPDALLPTRSSRAAAAALRRQAGKERARGSVTGPRAKSTCTTEKADEAGAAGNPGGDGFVHHLPRDSCRHTHTHTFTHTREHTGGTYLQWFHIYAVTVTFISTQLLKRYMSPHKTR